MSRKAHSAPVGPVERERRPGRGTHVVDAQEPRPRHRRHASCRRRSRDGGTMTLSRRRAPAILFAAMLVGAADPARAQFVVAETETLDFGRPESWGMKYYASLAVFSGMGAPQTTAAGEVALGFEGGNVPQLSDAERRIGFNGTKLEDVNKTHLFGRLRGSVGLGRAVVLEIGYTPPIERGGARPHILGLALGRPVQLAPSWRLGIRGHGHIGTITGDVTCGADAVAAGDDPEANPFQCARPSQD